MLATMGCFGVMATSLFGFGVSLAIERGQGWLQVKRASPMPIAAYFFAKLFSAVVFSTVIMLLLLAVGTAFGGVRLPLATAAKLVGILVAGSIPFSSMGLAIGYFAKPNSAPAVVNLIYLPMAFCSGLWIPLFMLPHGLRVFANLLPPIPHEPAGTERGRHGHNAGLHMAARRGTAFVHPGLPGTGSLGLLARRRQVVWMKRQGSGLGMQLIQDG